MKSILWTVVPSIIGKLLGKTGQGYIAAHKGHIKMLQYAFEESKRGEAKRQDLDNVKKTIAKINRDGKAFIKSVPKKPEIILNSKLRVTLKSLRNPKEYDMKSKLFVLECERVIRACENFINSGEKSLKLIEGIKSSLYDYKGAKASVLRQISDRNIDTEILIMEEMNEIAELKQILKSLSIIKTKYKRVISKK